MINSTNHSAITAEDVFLIVECRNSSDSRVWITDTQCKPINMNISNLQYTIKCDVCNEVITIPKSNDEPITPPSDDEARSNCVADPYYNRLNIIYAILTLIALCGCISSLAYLAYIIFFSVAVIDKLWPGIAGLAASIFAAVIGDSINNTINAESKKRKTHMIAVKCGPEIKAITARLREYAKALSSYRDCIRWLQDIDNQRSIHTNGGTYEVSTVLLNHKVCKCIVSNMAIHDFDTIKKYAVNHSCDEKYTTCCPKLVRHLESRGVRLLDEYFLLLKHLLADPWEFSGIGSCEGYTDEQIERSGREYSEPRNRVRKIIQELKRIKSDAT